MTMSRLSIAAAGAASSAAESSFQGAQVGLFRVGEDCRRTISQNNVSDAAQPRGADRHDPPGRLAFGGEMRQEGPVTERLQSNHHDDLGNGQASTADAGIRYAVWLLQ